MCPSVYLRPIL